MGCNEFDTFHWKPVEENDNDQDILDDEESSFTKNVSEWIKQSYCFRQNTLTSSPSDYGHWPLLQHLAQTALVLTVRKENIQKWIINNHNRNKQNKNLHFQCVWSMIANNGFTFVCSFLSCLITDKLSLFFALSSRNCLTTAEVSVMHAFIALSLERWASMSCKTHRMELSRRSIHFNK